MSTRLSVEQQATRRLGGHTGDINSGDATTAVLNGWTDTTGDDNHFRHWLLIMPDAANTGDITRNVTAWDDSAGQATWVGNRTDTTYTSETYMLLPRGSHTKVEMDNALNDRLDDTRFSVQSLLPTITDMRTYSLGRLDWIRSAEDVLAVYHRASPNMVDNSDFDIWGNGTASAPTRFSLTGTVARNNFVDNPTRITHGHYGVSLTNTGAVGTLDQYLPPELVIDLRGRTVTFEVNALSSNAATALRVTDTAGTTSDTHTGGGDTELLSVSHTVNSSADSLYVRLESPNGVTSHFDHLVAEDASSINTLLSVTGDTAWKYHRLAHTVRDVGGVPVVELPGSRGRRGQIVVWSKMPYPTVSSDSAITDCPDAVIVPGLVFELARIRKAGQDRERLDVIESRAAREYARTAGRLLQVPTPDTQDPVIVRSA